MVAGAGLRAAGAGRLRQTAVCALFCAMTAVGAWIRVPMPYFDYMTLQVLFVLLSGMLLGGRGGALAQGTYVLLGLAGVPVFAGGGGVSYILRPTFGYLVGFVAAARLTGYVSERTGRRKGGFFRDLGAGAAGLFVLYTAGIFYRWVITNYVMDTVLPFWALLMSCLTLEVPKDILSCVFAAWLAGRMRRRMPGLFPAGENRENTKSLAEQDF